MSMALFVSTLHASTCSESSLPGHGLISADLRMSPLARHVRLKTPDTSHTDQAASFPILCRGTGVTNHTYPPFDLIYPCSDNCRVGLYCDTNTTVCIQEKAFGASCNADKECSSYNCLPNQTCGESPSNPRHFAVWVYAVIGIGIFGGEYNSLLGNISCILFLP